ncbi:MAG: peptide-methionine (S)-S-oxide reductase MsrA [Planctomycetota bacterium]|nr:peptide-methionine (S)-S-oxide reductase MsrA [Planctomycetaceae bacterium]MDQ3329081.1 peptide-methionine (S)-S-oxide reductase MsrA [Planctomycetota bacterium]
MARDATLFPPSEVDVPADERCEQVAVLGAGCFWCVEAVFRRLDGVVDVVSGYAGGTAETANYRTVCGGGTDHAEVVRVTFDPQRISFGEILRIFFAVAHDPTQLNRQGRDVGRQYRSAVFFADDEQKNVAEAYVRQLNAAGVFDRPVATTIEPLSEFYPAEGYHQDYAALNPDQPYVACTVLPKLDKLQKLFSDRLTKD